MPIHKYGCKIHQEIHCRLLFLHNSDRRSWGPKKLLSAHVIYSILLQFIFVSCLSFSVEQNSSRILALLQLPFSERRYILLYTTVLLQEHCSQIYYDCQLNSDGSSWKTTQLRCDANLYFDPDTLSCTQPNNIEDCQDLSTTLHWRTTYVKWSNKKKLSNDC